MCYHFLDTELSWEDAREECRYMSGYHGDGDLASINSPREQDFIQGLYDCRSIHRVKTADKARIGAALNALREKGMLPFRFRKLKITFAIAN